MKVVVFGGSGFLGSHVADVLSDSGYEVTIIDKTPSPYARPDQQVIQGSILDRAGVEKALRGIDYVYHFAGVADIEEARTNPVEAIEANVLGTVYILDACRSNNVKRFVFASTVYVYSELGSFYRSSKQACELVIENYQKIFGLDYTVLRFGSLYGRRANEFNFIRKVIHSALTSGRIERLGNGEEIRDYIHVVDAARSSVQALSDEFRNGYVMITGQQTIKIRDLLNMINEMMGKKVVIEYLKDQPEEHYEITPYSFKPRVARKLVLREYHDLGQGILDCIYAAYKQLEQEGSGIKPDISLPSSVKY